MKKCKKCGFDHFDFQDCLKTFYYRNKDNFDGWRKIGAYNLKDASERAAIFYNSEVMDFEKYKDIAKNLLCYKFRKLKFTEKDFLNSVILCKKITCEMITEIKRIKKKYQRSKKR